MEPISGSVALLSHCRALTVCGGCIRRPCMFSLRHSITPSNNDLSCLLQAGSADFVQGSRAAASQRPPEAPKRSQQLGTTKLGRQRLQKKANSFADIVQLVAVADEEHRDRPKVSSAPLFRFFCFGCRGLWAPQCAHQLDCNRVSIFR